MEVKVAGIDSEPLRELAVRELPLAVLAEHLQNPNAERMAEGLQLLRLVEYQRVQHGRQALLHIETALSSRELGCSSAIQDCNGAAGGRPYEARRRILARLRRKDARYGVGLRLAGHDEDDLARAAQRRQAQRDAFDERLQPGLGREHPLALAKRGCVGEEGGDVAVRAETEQQQVELCVAELALVCRRGLFLSELAEDPVHGARPALQSVKERALGHAVVRFLVVGRHAAFVSPPELDLAPVVGALRRLLVRVLRCFPAREDDVAPFACGLRHSLADDRRDFLLVVEDDELDVVHCSPAASSRERSIAAWIALRKAARTPACSSSRIARMVVPPGDVTASRSSTGCIFSSRSSFAVPSIVCTTSCVDVSRPSPSRMPASIIASARSAKYAGPEPDTAVTASM